MAGLVNFRVPKEKSMTTAGSTTHKLYLVPLRQDSGFSDLTAKDEMAE